MKKFKKIIALASAVALIAASFAACGDKKKETANADPDAPLTYWCTMDGNTSNAGLQSYSEMMLFRKWKKEPELKSILSTPSKVQQVQKHSSQLFQAKTDLT